MRIVVDANILFAALIKNSTTAELFIYDEFQFFAPEFLFKEFMKYEDYLLKKTHRSKNDFIKFYNFLKNKITIVPKKEIIPFLKEARKISPDPKDTIYLALCLAINSSFWTNDKKLKEKQNLINVLTTEDIINKVKSFKKIE
ncbi:MAG: PIN domain-containing protein [Promethearchaeia archaeon]